ncbi:hypothetical protein ETF27_00475 [Prevotella brunnea]|uniref:Uncharacterized protein n=1 Tax=Prevotella brunnea TaxID=2508867 RepID=A0A5C8GMJ7_9BACT|nr:hypothetical protein [Prevotella brunnea]TXJ63397.1 hypothetical protein ETF27_00475 [Prevotella brunnea]
MKSFLTGIQH